MKAKALRFRIILLLLTTYFFYQGNTNKLLASETTNTQSVHPDYCETCAISLVPFDNTSELQKNTEIEEAVEYSVSSDSNKSLGPPENLHIIKKELQ